MYKEVKQSYSERASEYVATLGSVESMDPLDVELITGWGKSISGPILDAGSGPGHCTELLRSLGCDVRGLDLVPQFVDSARQRFPHSIFEMGNFLDLPFKPSSFGGVLAWYSLIHVRPPDREMALKEFARILKPNGTLLIGSFLGIQDVSFDHAITEAFYFSEKGLINLLESAGFQVISTHTRSSKGSRPHLAGVAQLP